MEKLKRPSCWARNNKRGLTLIEILVVVAILGLIAGVVGINVLNHWRDAEIKAARLDLQQIGTALDIFRMKYARYPSSAEGLRTLLNPPDGGESVLKKAELPKDPWGQEYVYRLEDAKRYTLGSKGPDHTLATDDDIVP